MYSNFFIIKNNTEYKYHISAETSVGIYSTYLLSQYLEDMNINLLDLRYLLKDYDNKMFICLEGSALPRIHPNRKYSIDFRLKKDAEAFCNILNSKTILQEIKRADI